MSLLRYRAAPETSWFHYLFGPRQDGSEGWIILPEVAPLESDHLDRIRSAIDAFQAPNNEDFSLSVVNISLGEAGLEPGRGGLALLLHFRLTDSEGEQHPFVHVLASYGRGLDREILHNTIWTFLRRVTRGRRYPERPIDRYFKAYRETKSRQDAFLVMDRYLRRVEPFDTVPARVSPREVVLEEGGLWPDVLDVTSTSETWEEVIQGIASISASLYDSVLPWAALTTSVVLPRAREGLIIRFLAKPQFEKDDNPLVILEELDVERAAVTLLPVIERKVSGGLELEFDETFLAEELPDEPLDEADRPPPAPPMLLDDSDTLPDDDVDLAAPMATTLQSLEEAEEAAPASFAEESIFAEGARLEDELLSEEVPIPEEPGFPEEDTPTAEVPSPPDAPVFEPPPDMTAAPGPEPLQVSPFPKREAREPTPLNTPPLRTPLKLLEPTPMHTQPMLIRPPVKKSRLPVIAAIVIPVLLAIGVLVALQPSPTEPAVAPPPEVVVIPDTPPEPVEEPSSNVPVAWVSPEGDATGIWLKKASGGEPVFLSGREPFSPGDYMIIAQFSPGGASQDITQITLAADDSIRIRCEVRTGACTVR